MIETVQTQGVKEEKVLKGMGLSPGIAVARTCRFNEKRHSNLEVYKVKGEGIDREVERVKRAIELAAEKVESLRKETEKMIGKAESEIFVAHRMILQDPALLNAIEELLRKEGTNAEAAVMVVLNSYETRMRRIDNDYVNDRASDFAEIKNKLLDILRNMNPTFQCADTEHCQRGKNRIIVSSELTPGMTVMLDTASTMGFVTERGGVNSHAAILARALGIPAVTGIPDIHESISCGTEIAINGDDGEVIIWPAESTLARMKKRADGKVRLPSLVEPVEGFSVMVNISTAVEVRDFADLKPEGIGLYRTEFEFMTAGRLLTEDEQYDRYSSVVKSMKGKPVTFRLFDAGGDKPLPFLDTAQEDNPALGLRGGRLLLENGELMETQARAIGRASQHGPVRVLYPMVVDLAQFRRLKKLFERAIDGIVEVDLQHGVMFEVPSACLDATRLMKEADFASIGTNDLIQYLFAVDRNNEKVAGDYKPDHPVFWKMIEKIARAAARQGKDVSICGELAGDPRYITKLIKQGIRAVSVSPRMISGVRTAAMDAIGDN